MNKSPSFMDQKTILAIALVGVVWFGWQSYLAKKYPQAPATTSSTTQKPIVESKNTNTVGTSEASPVVELKSAPAQAELLTAFENDDIKFHISSIGMGLKNIELKKFKDRKGQQIRFQTGHEEGIFRLTTGAADQPLFFQVRKINETTFEGKAQIGQAEITRTIEILPQGFGFKNHVQVSSPQESSLGLNVLISEEKMAYGGSSLLAPSFEHQEFVVNHEVTTDRVMASGLKESLKQDFSNVKWGALSSQYFTLATVNLSELIPQVSVHAPLEKNGLNFKMSYLPSMKQKDWSLDFVTYSGPKSLRILKEINSDLKGVINFGWFSKIAEVLLFTLKWIFQFAGNWGWSIIILTIFVRLLVLPFNLMGYKSMKKMQNLQPRMQAVRVKFKDDPTKMNQEIMALMRENKVNPLGGCLPMLLQMPVFFALYQVLGQSVELYQAPFFGWIHDLSAKDPYYVLPVLMGLSMWVHQKITPTTMDPTQAKIMQFLPILFSFMMISLPSGLTLYIFVSTLFGVLQQQVFMSDRSAISVKNLNRAT